MTEEQKQALIEESIREIERMSMILAAGSVAHAWAKTYELEIYRHQVFVAFLSGKINTLIETPDEVTDDDAEYCYEKPKAWKEGANWMLSEVKKQLNDIEVQE